MPVSKKSITIRTYSFRRLWWLAALRWTTLHYH